MTDDRRKNYLPYIALETRGAGLIGLMTCTRCGVAVMLDKKETPELHDRWHDTLAPPPHAGVGGTG